jgi:hypothetical protein
VERFDRKGRLVFPSPQKLRAAKKAGVVVEQEKLHVTRAFCPRGHALITDQSTTFGGRPGIKLWAQGKGGVQAVTLSPFQGDGSKDYDWEFEAGEVLDVRCPVCGTPLPEFAPCGCTPGSAWILMFLKEKQDVQNAIGVCNAWGCPRSYIRLSGEILAEYRVSMQP